MYVPFRSKTARTIAQDERRTTILILVRGVDLHSPYPFLLQPSWFSTEHQCIMTEGEDQHDLEGLGKSDKEVREGFSKEQLASVYAEEDTTKQFE